MREDKLINLIFIALFMCSVAIFYNQMLIKERVGILETKLEVRDE